MTENTHLKAALTWANHGFSVIPIAADGTKRPVVKWTEFQSRRALDTEIETWFGRNPTWGIGVITGSASGNLELTELEAEAVEPAMWDRVCVELEKDPEAYALWDKLTTRGFCEWSPSGGMHLLYRIYDDDGERVPGNTKLATRPATAEDIAAAPGSKVTTLAETRGEGGYVVVAPTSGAVHSSYLPWTVLAGTIGVVPTISMDLRNRLHAAITRALHVEPLRPVPLPRPPAPVRPQQSGELSPGDDFNARATWEEIIGAVGWTVSPRAGDKGEILWVRPGKHWTEGHSASTGYAGDGDRLYVWSSSTEFPIEEPINKFHAYTLINHGGDHRAAAKELSRRGYGTRLVSTPAPVATSNPEWEAAVGTLHAAAEWSMNNDGSPPLVVADPDPGWVPVFDPNGSWDQVGVSDRLLGVADRFRCSGDQKAWFAYEAGVWRRQSGTVPVTRAAIAVLDRMRDFAGQQFGYEKNLVVEEESREDRRERIADAKALVSKASALRTAPAISGAVSLFGTQPAVACNSSDFDGDLHLLNLRNGTLDLNTGEVRGHDARDMITRMFNADYDPDASCPRWEQFLADVLPDPEVRAYVQRALGYTLTGRADQRAMMQLYGPSSTGKTQFIRVVQELFGGYGRNAEPSVFRWKRDAGGATPELHALRGGRFIATSETSESARMDEEAIKRITGADRVTSRGLYEQPQEWQPEGVVWMATNFPPAYNSDDRAMWNRVKPIKFEVRFSADGKPDENGDETRAWVPNIYRLLLEEASGILNWMLAGLGQFREFGELGEPSQVTSAMLAQRDESDSVASFLIDAELEGDVELKADERADIRGMYVLYANWCDVNRMPPLGRRRMTNRLLARGWLQVKSNGKTFWHGVRLTGAHGIRGSM